MSRPEEKHCVDIKIEYNNIKKKQQRARSTVQNSESFHHSTTWLGWTHLQHWLARGRVHPGVGGGLGWDGEALPLPQHSGRRVGHNVTADVDWVPLPWVVDGVVGQELGYVCGDRRVSVSGGQWATSGEGKLREAVLRFNQVYYRYKHIEASLEPLADARMSQTFLQRKEHISVEFWGFCLSGPSKISWVLMDPSTTLKYCENYKSLSTPTIQSRVHFIWTAGQLQRY